ncbi:SDR family NAD(P)-dependent oxidoreductase [Microbacterium sp. A82]|uniref:SDR family NAD(P)-dependent oxidoreductase n=1 Tax=Microbacterium sp. A82 TaxID=3450452 RepID=UPI003F3D4315
MSTVVIAGGAGEIGRALAHAYAADGSNVHVVDRSDAAEAVAADVGGTAHIVDTSDPASAAVFGGIGEIDTLINAVGVWPTLSVDELVPEKWVSLARINFDSGYHAVWGSRAGLRATQGSVVNIASAIALKGHARMVHYAAAKAGVIGMTRSLALALGPDGVRVNAVAPGLVATERNLSVWTPEQRAEFRATRALPIDLTVNDVVDSIRFLSSSAARAITGQTIVVDGGTVLH